MNYLLNIADNKQQLNTFAAVQKRRRYVRFRLKELGIGPIEALRSEVQYLPYIMHTGEKIGAFVTGRCARGHIMMVATDRRIIVLDCKPLINNIEDITYDSVSGVSFGSFGLFCSINLFTKLGDFSVKTSNHAAARNFKRYIDKGCIEIRSPSRNGGNNHETIHT